MRGLSLLIAILLFPPASFGAGEKVVERSAKKVPSWVYGMETGYIITTADGKSMAEARDRAMEQVKERIIASVAEHISSESSRNTSETVHNGEIESIEIFKKQIRTQSGYIPFISNVSEAYVSDVYWEKIRTSDKGYRYKYNIKYPLSPAQIGHIIYEFRQREDMLNRRAEVLSRVDFARMQSVEEMLDTISALRVFQSSLPAGDARIEKCNAIRQQYAEMIKHIQVRYETVTREEAVYHLYYGEHVVSYTKEPKTSSNCLTATGWEPCNGGGRIRYNYDAGCYEDESNSLTVTYTIHGVKVSRKVLIP